MCAGWPWLVHDSLYSHPCVVPSQGRDRGPYFALEEVKAQGSQCQQSRSGTGGALELGLWMHSMFFSFPSEGKIKFKKLNRCLSCLLNSLPTL